MRVDASQIPESVGEYPDIETWDIEATFAELRAAPQSRAQARLAQLVPGAVHITTTHSGRNIHLIPPQLVIDAVRSISAPAIDR